MLDLSGLSAWEIHFKSWIRGNALFRLARAMDWSVFEKEFRPLYCTEGRPALPIRRLAGLLMLKSLRNLSDEEVVVFWSENPYAQDFCGEKEM
jgi:IS5 family transposase